MATRNPVSVLPVPVGEATSTSSPDAIRGHPRRWGSVGPDGKRFWNHRATAGWKLSRTLSGADAPAGDPRGLVCSGRDSETVTTTTPAYGCHSPAHPPGGMFSGAATLPISGEWERPG